MSEVAVTGKTWDELIDAGRRALSGAAWALGDLAAEVEIGYGEKSLQRYADELEVKHEQLLQLRRVSRAYPNSVDRSIVSWTVAWALAGQDDRFDLIQSRAWTKEEARELVKHRKQELTAAREKLALERSAVTGEIEKIDAQVKHAGEASKSLLLNLYEIVKTAQDSKIHTDVVHWTHERGEHDGLTVDGCSLCQAQVASNAPLKLYLTFPEVNHDISKLVTYVQDSANVLSDADREAILGSIREMRGALDLMESMTVNGGVTDEALQRLLEQIKND